MEPLTLKARTPVESPEVENWDDDDFENLDDVHFRTASTATSIISHPQTNHRDSVSSRMSMRSESNNGDENWDVLVDEQAPIKDAIALAKSKGIPLPSNVPRSALEGGTIRRLKGKEIKKAIADDWSEDLDLPGSDVPLKLAKHDDRDLSENLRQISAAFRTSPKTPETSKDLFDKTIRSPKSRIAPTPITLDAFRDTEEDADFADVPTIRVAKHRSPQKPLLFEQPPTPLKPQMESIEEGLELPADGQLRLSTRKPQPQTPQQGEDFDIEWAEGSLGTRHAGRKGGRSARSSSASALSPSVSSAFTAESEDEGLDGLVLPDGPISFEAKLKQRQLEQAPDNNDIPEEKANLKRTSGKDDFFTGLEIPDGEVFDSAKLTLNRNVKHKNTRTASPTRRTATTLNFTSTKTGGTISRLPRFQPTHDRHERPRSHLEPVSETGAVISTYQRPSSRIASHSGQVSATAIPAPTTPSTPSAPSTPSRRLLRGAESRPDLRYEQPTTTNAQLLRAKRSMPAMRGVNSPTKASPYVRPPSRQEAGSRLNVSSRPKTPTDRLDTRPGDPKKANVPFIPAGGSVTQSHNINLKNTTSRHYRGQGSDGSGDSMSAAQRSLSRLAGLGRPETPRGRSNFTPAELAAQAKKTITKPTKRRNYGDGSELEIFDDLPTSASLESKFTKQPVGRGAPRSLRSKLGLSHLNPSTSSLASTRRGSDTPVPGTPLTPHRNDFPTTALNTTNVPRFARDTAASRNAREQRQISTTFQNIRGEPLQPISTNWKPLGATRLNQQGSLRKKKSEKPQQKPQLIKGMGSDLNSAKTVKGMQYNPLLFRWEGNENALAPFDVPDFHPRGGSPSGQGQGSPGTKANMALISNVGSITGVQVVGGMVFDPSQMRWLKIAEHGTGSTTGIRGENVQVEDEEDVFAGLEDLKEEDETRSRSGALQNLVSASQSRESFGDADGGHSSGEDWGVAEEFDVGPEFVRRQRTEEERWRRKVEKWLRTGADAEDDENTDGTEGWRWAIRDLVMAGL